MAESKIRPNLFAEFVEAQTLQPYTIVPSETVRQLTAWMENYYTNGPPDIRKCVETWKKLANACQKFDDFAHVVETMKDKESGNENLKEYNFLSRYAELANSDEQVFLVLLHFSAYHRFSKDGYIRLIYTIVREKAVTVMEQNTKLIRPMLHAFGCA
ncbi:hypothetical protein KC906_03920 [Candidatus Kaiserbacteria bacterium]|nr:hypothetical protein [Candidatus Kaiserbacteria bacterium]MCB9812378.1 hypothetical protein [Candidatus Nomurabacteria bacterium]